MTVAVAYTFFARGLRLLPAATVSTLTLVEPATATLLGVALLGERLTAEAVVGVAVLMLAVLLLALPARRGGASRAGHRPRVPRLRRRRASRSSLCPAAAPERLTDRRRGADPMTNPWLALPGSGRRRPLVEASWERARRHRLDPERLTAPLSFSSDELREYRMEPPARLGAARHPAPPRPRRR